jgi:hypothetical protein
LRGIIGPNLETILSASKEAKISIAISDQENSENAEIQTSFFVVM